MSSKEIGLYIHIPFCKSKCHYCDFNSYAGMEHTIPAYFRALKQEVEYYSHRLEAYSVETVFIGGGTPSVVEKEYITEIMNLCKEKLNISDNAEISIETNPGTLDYDKLVAYRRSGINRLSIGLQAWQNQILKGIGRIHCSEEFESNLCLARKAGFENINVDLIFGLPGQSIENWEETLIKVTNLGVQHLSCYSLKIEEGTIFGDKLKKGEMNYIDDDIDREMYYKAKEYLSEKGFKHYEISNFAMPGFTCRHNLVYWKAKPYIGLGAGSHSYFKDERFSNPSSIEKYITHIENGEISFENIDKIEGKDKISEFIILGLRLIDGISLREFQQLFHESIFDIYEAQIAKLTDERLLMVDGDRLKLTAKGLDLANQVFVKFI